MIYWPSALPSIAQIKEIGPGGSRVADTCVLSLGDILDTSANAIEHALVLARALDAMQWNVLPAVWTVSNTGTHLWTEPDLYKERIAAIGKRFKSKVILDYEAYTHPDPQRGPGYSLPSVWTTAVVPEWASKYDAAFFLDDCIVQQPNGKWRLRSGLTPLTTGNRYRFLYDTGDGGVQRTAERLKAFGFPKGESLRSINVRSWRSSAPAMRKLLNRLRTDVNVMFAGAYLFDIDNSLCQDPASLREIRTKTGA